MTELTVAERNAQKRDEEFREGLKRAREALAAVREAEAEVDASYGPLVSAGTTGAMATRRRRD
jgi:hypothetical protein